MRDPLERYFVYILLCSDTSYYVGITNDVPKRCAEHGEGMDPSCYTYKRRPLTLVFQQGFREATDAIAFEKQIKGWSRRLRALRYAQPLGCATQRDTSNKLLMIDE